MTKLQSSLDVVIEMLRDLEEFKRSGSKDAFRRPRRFFNLGGLSAARRPERVPPATD
jgi:hypothetical protein